MELYVHTAMGLGAARIDVHQLIEDEATAKRITSAFHNFDARGARCYLEVDTDRLMGTIEAGFGSVENFSAAVGALLKFAAPVSADKNERRMSIMPPQSPNVKYLA